MQMGVNGCGDGFTRCVNVYGNPEYNRHLFLVVQVFVPGQLEVYT